ncbi:MAG: response regulator transcription factor [Oscillospiraceae bacterium]|nr:response regulator transcription factor [Oscillospiraceae bacterium]
MRILIVEDEVRLAATLAELLHRQGYTTDICHDGLSGLDNAMGGIYDLIMLDGMLPKLDGFSLLRQLRGSGNTTPVLMLTARSEVSDRVEGLDSGADYYLTKPFEVPELLACVRLLLRRSGEARNDDAIICGDLRLEQGTFLLHCGDRSVRLSRREYDLMELLMRNYKLIVTKEQILLKVWGYDAEVEDNNAEVYISFLRRKLTHLHSTVKIRTIRMVGYCLEVAE